MNRIAKSTLVAAAVVCAALIGAAFPVSAQQAEETRVVVFDISGMITPDCPTVVESAVRPIEGVRFVSASLERRTATVRYAPERTSPGAIRRVIENRTRYTATPRQ